MIAHSAVRQAMSVLALLAAITAPAAAQKGREKGGSAPDEPTARSSAKPVAGSASRGDSKAKRAAPAKAKPAKAKAAKQRVTHVQAVDVSRRVLVEQGYTVTRVDRVGDTRVIHYYRGNNGRGKGRGPLQRMVVRPSADRFVFEGAPADVKRAVTLRLQF